MVVREAKPLVGMQIPWESELTQALNCGGAAIIGIYKITKKENGKSYIGQSNDIERRLKEHQTKTDIPIEIAIHKYGIDAFTYEVLEECSLDELDEKEVYWIEKFNTYKGKGYNCNPGGGNNQGENNGRTKLTNDDVAYIRECYDVHMRRRQVYEQFKDKISFSSFASIWDGSTWKNIKPEVYTEENKNYYKYHATDGAKSEGATFTSEEVIKMRERYVNETAKNIYEDYKDRCSYQTLQQILWGRTYTDLPIYKKKTKTWVNK